MVCCVRSGRMFAILGEQTFVFGRRISTSMCAVGCATVVYRGVDPVSLRDNQVELGNGSASCPVDVHQRRQCDGRI